MVATLKLGDEVSPVADTVVGADARWYLVKAKSGVIGWIRQSDSDESRKLEKFFKSLPAEPSLPLSSAAPSTSTGGSERSIVTVPVLMNGASVIVPVTLNDALRARLADSRVEGLLGLDFLKHFHVSLDARRNLLILGPR